MSVAPLVNVLENVLSIMSLGLVLELICRSRALRDMIVGEIIYPSAKEGLLDKPFPVPGLETINVRYAYEKYGSTSAPLVIQSFIWNPRTHCVVVNRDK